MANAPARIGVIADGEVAGWQREALAELRAFGVTTALPGTGEIDDAVLLFNGAAAHGAGAPRWGVWEIVLPGDPAGFEATERAAPTVSVRLERVDGPRTLLAETTVRVDPTSYGRTLGRIEQAARTIALDAVRRASAGIAGSAPAPDRTVPIAVGPIRTARLSVLCLVRRVANAVGRRLLHPRWRVGLLRTPPSALLEGEPPAIVWLDLPRNRFWADPFPLVSDKGVEVLLEGYDYGLDRGYLARVALDGDRVAGPVRPLARREHHLSYPFVVEDGDRRYVLPEESQRGGITLYAVDEEGLHESRTLVEGVRAIDPTLFRHEGRWWLFTGEAGSGENAELSLFHAASLDGPWQAHPQNPIVRDVRCARSGGTPFEVDGALYRPGQDCSTDYGAQIALARIDVLTPDAYRETVVAQLAPPPDGPGRHGLHTFALRGGVCLVDGKDVVFDPAATWAILRTDLRRLFHRPRSHARSNTLVTEVTVRS